MPKRLQHQNSGIEVSLANEQATHVVNEAQLIEAVTAVIRDSAFASADISIAIVDDPTMHELNRQYLEHDYPTDVLSFVLEDAGSHLEGEVILSADTAATEAGEHSWSTAAEMLLYAVHGTLHLVGYRDKSPDETSKMRAAEQKYLVQFGFHPFETNSQSGHEGDGKVPNAGDRRTGR